MERRGVRSVYYTMVATEITGVRPIIVTRNLTAKTFLVDRSTRYTVSVDWPVFGSYSGRSSTPSIFLD